MPSQLLLLLQLVVVVLIEMAVFHRGIRRCSSGGNAPR